MKTKNKTWSTAKEILFLYLATSKILYWFNTIMQTTLDGFDANIIELVLNRFFQQDMLIILAIIAFLVIEKITKKIILQYIILYVFLLSAAFLQIWLVQHFVGPIQMFDGGVAGILISIGYLGFFIYFTAGFAAIAIALIIKDRFKSAGKKSIEADSTEAMNDFSNALVCDSCKDELRDKLSLFGQFVGEWEFEGILGKGTPEEQRIPGEWIFSWILDGTAIQDVFICPSRKECEKNPTPNAEYGTTIRFYNQATDVWDMFYGLSGATHILEGKQVGDQIVVNNKSESESLTQWIFSNIKSNSFHWQNQTSHDNGATWNVNFELSAKRK